MRIRAILVATIAAVGVILAVIGWMNRPSSLPGQLVADEPMIVWQSPIVELGQPLAQAKAKFRLMNSGGRLVNILSVGSGCGCAKPVPSATVIGPGQSITLDVEGSPFPIGDRTIPITVHTDSAATPSVDLRLRMLGSRTPPFLLDATGELAFLNVERANLALAGETRRFTVRMIELDSAEREPSFRVTPPGLVVEKVSSQARPYITPGSVVRTHVYNVSFAEPPIESRIAGMVSVVDPWFAEHVTDLKVYAEIRSRIRAVPAWVELSNEGGPESSAEFLVLTNEPDSVPIDQYRVEAEQPWRVEPITANGGVAKSRVVGQLPVGSAEMMGKVTVRIPSITGESAVVAVMARRAKP